MQKHVLVVEDDNDILELLKLYLEASEFYNDAKDEWL